MGVDDIGGGAPAVESTTNIDFDSMTSEDLDSIITSGGEVPEKFRQAAPPVVDDPPVADPPAEEEDEPATGDDPPVTDPPAVEEEADEEAAPAADEDDAVDFTFTENADPETRQKERREYLAKFALPEPMQVIFDELVAENEQLRTESAPQADDETRSHMSAFDQLVQFKQDGNQFVPDTEGVRNLFQRSYPNEYSQLVRDVNMEDSHKYPGYTRLQEFVRDGFNLSEEGMKVLDTFLENGGDMPVPKFVPDGIKPELAEAYWKSFDRDELDDRLRKAMFTLGDEAASDEERMSANLELSRMNTKLSQVQNGLNFDRDKNETQAKARVQTQQTIVNAGVQRYVGTTLKLLENTRTEIANSLTMFDPATAGVAAAGLAVLVENALSDADEYAKAAQASLEAQGIKLDWAAGKATLEKLWVTEQRIAALEHLEKQKQVHPRAIALAKKDLAKVLLEIRGHEKALIGKLTKKLAGGAGEALKTTLKDVPRLKNVRPRLKGDGKTIGGIPNFDQMSKEQLDSYIGEKKYLEAQHGAGSS
jgi:hypothetical protein